MLVLDLDRADALHLAVALDLHARTLRDAHGTALPVALERLRAHAWNAAKGVSEAQVGPTLAEIAGRWSAPGVTQLAHRYSDAARVLNVSVSTVKRLVADGALCAVKINGSVRIRHDDLQRYLESLAPTRPIGERIEVKSISSPGVGEQQRRPGRSPRTTVPAPPLDVA